MVSLAVDATGLARSYDGTVAVDGVSLAIEPGELFALLGPNGSGKTTAIGMLCCLLRPDEGSAMVLGKDVTTDPMGVKSVISVVPQETAVAEHLNGWENLRLMAGLHGIPAARSRARSGELLEVLGLRGKADKQARTYSGGLKRRLSIAMALVSDPQVLFLDEPTLGLDPQARRGMWEHIASLKGEVTILLTTHYLEEADALADRVAIIDDGKIVAEGTPEQLKAGVSAGSVTLVRAEDVSEATLRDLQAVYPQAVAVGRRSGPGRCRSRRDVGTRLHRSHIGPRHRPLPSPNGPVTLPPACRTPRSVQGFSSPKVSAKA